MRIINKRLLMVTAIVLGVMLIIQKPVYANNDSLYSIGTEEFKKTFNNIGYSVVNNDAKILNKYSKYFTDDAFKSFLIFVNSNTLNGYTLETQIDTIHNDNSDTNDSVVMYNIKLNPYNKDINILIMLEMHINKDGIIYGYNIWTY